jgi:prepilin-type processing-associated H-X9-DG protein
LNLSWGCGRRAFTRTELLVVVVLGAMLAVLLGFGLSYAKERARRTRCLNNVRAWARALSLYAADHEFIPREGHRRDGKVRRDNWANIADPANKDAWYNALPPYLGERPARTYASFLTGERPRFYENRLFHCPSAKFQTGVGRDNDAFFSVVMNSKLIRSNVLHKPECSIRFDTIQRPAMTVAFLEARVYELEPWVDVLQLNSDLGQPSASASRFAGRRHGQGNLAFCDGHAEWQPGTNVVEIRPGRNRGFAIFPNGQILWCANPAMDPNQQSVTAKK